MQRLPEDLLQRGVLGLPRLIRKSPQTLFGNQGIHIALSRLSDRNAPIQAMLSLLSRSAAQPPLATPSTRASRSSQPSPAPMSSKSRSNHQHDIANETERVPTQKDVSMICILRDGMFYRKEESIQHTLQLICRIRCDTFPMSPQQSSATSSALIIQLITGSRSAQVITYCSPIANNRY